MRHLMIWLLLVSAALAGNNTLVGPATTVAAGDKIRATTYNDNFARIYAEVRGNIGTLNLLDQAVTTSKIANAPNGVSAPNLNSDVLLQLVPTGAVVDFAGVAAPSGWVFIDGKTIGDGTSGGTERANADTLALYTLLWNSFADAQCPVSSGRGASASADFSSHKTITLPDARGRVIAALDNLGGSAANRLTNGGSGIVGTTIGAAGGAETHTLSSGEMPAHNHSVNDPGHSHGVSDPGHSHTNTHNHGINDPGHTHTFNIDGVLNNVPGGSNQSVRNVLVNGGTATTNGAATGITVLNAGITTSSNATGLSVNSASTGVNLNNTGGGGAHTVTQPTYVLSKIIKLYYPANMSEVVW